MYKAASAVRVDGHLTGPTKTGFEHEYDYQVELSRLQLQWVVTPPSDAILFYPLKAINGQDNDSDKVIFYVDLRARCLQVRIG